MQDPDRSLDERPHSGPELAQLELVRRAQLGSAVAFEQLVRRYGPDLYRYLLVRLRSESDARDALQETMTAAWLGLPGLRDPARFWPWLVAIASRKCATVRRKRMHASELEPPSLGEDDHEALEVWDAVGLLPARYREVLILRYRLELSEQEVADALGIRIGTVKSRCARGRKALQVLLS